MFIALVSYATLFCHEVPKAEPSISARCEKSRQRWTAIVLGGLYNFPETPAVFQGLEHGKPQCTGPSGPALVCLSTMQPLEAPVPQVALMSQPRRSERSSNGQSIR